jgi:hypothetical protein
MMGPCCLAQRTAREARQQRAGVSCVRDLGRFTVRLHPGRIAEFTLMFRPVRETPLAARAATVRLGWGHRN